MHRDLPVGAHHTVVDRDSQLIDVRGPEEIAEGSLPGARNVPLGELPRRLAELDPSRRVVVLCRSGGRSVAACELLTDAGFVDVINLAGGMLAWSEGVNT